VPEAKADADQSETDNLNRDKSTVEAGETLGKCSVCKVGLNILRDMMDDAVFPELSAFVTAQKAECAGHATAVDNQCPHDSFRIIPLRFDDKKVNQPVNDFLPEEQGKHCAKCCHCDTALCRDHVKAVKIRIEAFLSLVAGDENQVVERHDATKDSDQQGSESL